MFYKDISGELRHLSFALSIDEMNPFDQVRSNLSTQNFCPVPRTHVASRKGPLDGADPPSFSARVVDPTQLPRRASQFDPIIDKERVYQ